jgi:hypothetical protein
MKKQILITCFAFASLWANAQLKVYSDGKIYIGGTGTTPLSNLSIGGAGNSAYTAYFYNPSTASYSTGLYSTIAAGNSGYGYCVNGAMTCGSGLAYGIAGSSYNSTAQSAGRSYGVYGQAGNATGGYNYGVMGRLLGSNNGSGVVGIDRTNGEPVIQGNYAGFFYGLIRTTNDAPEKPNSGGFTGYSDSRLKKNIVPFKDGLAVLRKINPISYQFNGIGDLPTAKTNIGVVAQDIQKIAPYCVSTGNLVVKQSEAQNFGSDIVSTLPADSSGVSHSIVNALTYNYDALIYVLINSVKQLDSTVAALQAQVEKCCPQGALQRTTQNNSSQGNAAETTINVQLANSSVLYQNEPNPTNSNTTIRYYIPENIQGAYIVFYDFYGKEIKKVEVKETGSGKIEADTQNLSEGIYSYSLIVNGKVIDTKKMMKNK